MEFVWRMGFPLKIIFKSSEVLVHGMCVTYGLSRLLKNNIQHSLLCVQCMLVLEANKCRPVCCEKNLLCYCYLLRPRRYKWKFWQITESQGSIAICFFSRFNRRFYTNNWSVSLVCSSEIAQHTDLSYNSTVTLYRVNMPSDSFLI